MWDNVGYLKEGNVKLPRETLLLFKKKFPHFSRVTVGNSVTRIILSARETLGVPIY